MPNEATAWLDRLKAVEREYATAKLAVMRLERQARNDPQVLTGQLRIQDIIVTSEQLEGTYIVRLFSEFETALRHFLRATKLSAPGKAEPLINKVRDRVGISSDHADETHKVRIYRNALVHDLPDPVNPVTMAEARKHCCTFLSWLQRRW